jgi:hypothetical protein
MSDKGLGKLVIAAIAIAAAVAVIGAAYTLQGLAEERREIPMEIKVEDRLAFNLDPDALRFGATPPGSSAERGIEIKNYKLYPLKVEMYATGMLSDWLRSYENYFVVMPQESRNVTFTVDVPAEASFGSYTGTLLIEMKRVWA